mmetsp:Transcript_17879/g.33740  ORF Transcript_17879/g.33740 Transcript_17879/m.33740 type:complete len:150 (+) Transcript_17879:1207-1656(+)
MKAETGVDSFKTPSTCFFKRSHSASGVGCGGAGWTPLTGKGNGCGKAPKARNVDGGSGGAPTKGTGIESDMELMSQLASKRSLQRPSARRLASTSNGDTGRADSWRDMSGGSGSQPAPSAFSSGQAMRPCIVHGGSGDAEDGELGGFIT